MLADLPMGNRSGRSLVSAIVPTRNRAALLSGALDSIYAQNGIGDRFDIEAIVVDDASTDSTPEVVRRFPEARYIRLTTCRGASVARNMGIAAGRGVFVAFLDDDDIWLPHRLTAQVPILESRLEAGAVYSQARVQEGAEELLWPDAGRAVSGQIFGALLREDFLSVPCVLVRRQAFEVCGLFDETLETAEDWDLWLRLSFRLPFLYVPGPVAVVRQSSDGKHFSAVASGRYEPTIQRIVERALAVLPDAGAHAGMKREVRARVEMTIAERLSHIGQHEAARPHLLTALQLCPPLAGDPAVRLTVSRIASRLALASSSPLPTTRTLCQEVNHLTARQGFIGYLRARRLIAHIWSDVAVGLSEGRGAQVDPRLIGSAVAEAIWHNPSLLRKTNWVRRVCSPR
jgi:GT2 family glycosyltransferase